MSYRSPEPPIPTSPDAAPVGHPSPERLAELADGTPTAVEARHLADCLPCRRELAALRSLVADARLERDRVAPPLTSWDTLGAALRAEGLIASPAADAAGHETVVHETVVHEAVVREAATAGVLPLRARGAARPPALRWAARAAAVLLLAGGGLVAGRLSAGAAPVPGLALGGGAPERTVATILADSAPPPSSTDEAMAILTRAERDYRIATAYLADETAPVGAEIDRPELYQRRLAVMDEVAALTRAALAESPHDPVLNQYYLASLGAREATLRHLATSLSTDAQLIRF